MLRVNNKEIKNILKVNKIKKLLMNISYIILIPLLLYNIILIVKVVTNPKKIPTFFGIKTFVIASGSMTPSLKIGDITVVKVVDEDSLKIDDIISFRQGQSIITHRINCIIDDNGKKIYQTKGDNNNTIDQIKVTYDDIEGKYITKIPYLGKIVLLLQEKTIIIVIVLFYYILTIYDRKNMQRKKELRNKKYKSYKL